MPQQVPAPVANVFIIKVIHYILHQVVSSDTRAQVQWAGVHLTTSWSKADGNTEFKPLVKTFSWSAWNVSEFRWIPPNASDECLFEGLSTGKRCPDDHHTAGLLDVSQIGSPISKQHRFGDSGHLSFSGQTIVPVCRTCRPQLYTPRLQVTSSTFPQTKLLWHLCKYKQKQGLLLIQCTERHS